MSVRRRFLIGVLALVVVGCQSETTANTDADVTEPTQAAPDETGDPGSVSGMEDMPEECVEALRDYLQAIEPIVEGVDFQAMSQEDFDALGEQLAVAEEGLAEQVENCPELDVSVEESFAIMREFAEGVAPGTVAYFDFAEDFLAGFEEIAGVSGDCETDIAAFQEYVDRGGSMSDLTAEEVTHASGLMSTIAVACSDERFLEWQESVDPWVQGG